MKRSLLIPLAALLVSITGCVSNRLALPGDPISGGTGSSSGSRSFSIEDEHGLGAEIASIKENFRKSGFKMVNAADVLTNGVQSVCDRYPLHVHVHPRRTMGTDAGGDDFITAFSLGLIPTWRTDHPIAEYDVTVIRNCVPERPVHFVEYEERVMWLPLVMVWMLPKYRESARGVGSDLVDDVVERLNLGLR